MGSRTGENRPDDDVRLLEMTTDEIRELEARCVRAEEERDELERLAFEANEREKGLEQQIVRAEEAIREAAIALREASLKLDDAGMQFAASQAHKAALAAVPEENK